MTDMTRGHANWIVGVLVVLILGFMAGTGLVAIGEALEQAYDQGYQDGATQAPYRIPAFGRIE